MKDSRRKYTTKEQAEIQRAGGGQEQRKKMREIDARKKADTKPAKAKPASKPVSRKTLEKRSNPNKDHKKVAAKKTPKASVKKASKPSTAVSATRPKAKPASKPKANPASKPKDTPESRPKPASLKPSYEGKPYIKGDAAKRAAAGEVAGRRAAATGASSSAKALQSSMSANTVARGIERRVNALKVPGSNPPKPRPTLTPAQLADFKQLTQRLKDAK